jgi:WhiB family redox-sensing transcriptional regulator
MFATTAPLDWTRPTWFDHARCNDANHTLTSLFFSEQLDDIARAKAVCGNCAVAEECLAAAVERREPWGVWGGELLLNGRVMAPKRRRGRPPKSARPQPVMDELGRTWLADDTGVLRLVDDVEVLSA